MKSKMNRRLVTRRVLYLYLNLSLVLQGRGW